MSDPEIAQCGEIAIPFGESVHFKKVGICTQKVVIFSVSPNCSLHLIWYSIFLGWASAGQMSHSGQTEWDIFNLSGSNWVQIYYRHLKIMSQYRLDSIINEKLDLCIYLLS